MEHLTSTCTPHTFKRPALKYNFPATYKIIVFFYFLSLIEKRIQKSVVLYQATFHWIEKNQKQKLTLCVEKSTPSCCWVHQEIFYLFAFEVAEGRGAGTHKLNVYGYFGEIIWINLHLSMWNITINSLRNLLKNWSVFSTKCTMRRTSISHIDQNRGASLSSALSIQWDPLL